MKLDDNKLRDALKTVHAGRLTRAEAAAIIDVARFAASVDGRMDMNEMATVARLSKIIYAMSGEAEVPVPSSPMPPAWLREVPKQLVATGPRELAYVSVRVVTLADSQVAKEESTLGTKLTEALSILPARARKLDELVIALVRGAS